MRTYSDGSPARHTVNVFAAGQLLVSVTRAGTIAVAFNDANRWRVEAATATMYDGRTFGGAARKGAALLTAAAMHPEAVRYAELGVYLLLATGLGAALLMSRGAAPRQRRRPAWLRLASASVSLVFVYTGCGGPGGGEFYQRSGYLLSGDTTKGPAIGTYFYHRNHINSSSVITDANGNVMARMVYLPFGELSQANSSGGDIVTSKFTGQEYDEELGLYYFGARYYDPAIGRFISADSIVPSASDAQAFNRYTYARDNPIVYVDPTGHFLDFIGDFFSAVWSGISAIGSAIAAAATWVYNAAIDYVKFGARVFYFVGLTLYGIATNPWALASFVLGAILCCTIVGIPEGLYMWATSVAIAITATSMAQAAGVSNPYVLAVIGVAAGVLAGGGWSWSQFFKSAGQAAVGMGAQAVGGGPGGLAANLAFMAVGAVEANVNKAMADAPATPQASPAEQWCRASTIEVSIAGYYASNSTNGWAWGFSAEICTINPFTSSGGGVQFGINLQWTSESGWHLYSYSTPHDVPSHGFLIGGDATFNYAEGSGSWTGQFNSVGGSVDIISGSIFWTPGSGPGWRGYSIGLGVGPPGIGITQTDYKFW